MSVEIFSLVTFNSTHSAIGAEKELILANISAKIIPIPREITADCGLSIKVNIGENLDEVKKILENKQIEAAGYYYVKKAGLKKEIYDYK